jgi:hypothetical protein
MSYIGRPFPAVPGHQAASFFYHKRQQARTARKPAGELNIQAIADVDNLAACFEILKRENGQAPGPDGVRYTDLGRSELFEVLRPVSRAILDGTYRPGPARVVKIPKPGSRGFRVLRLRNLVDRVVAKALNEALTPFWEKVFLPGSHGFRPDLSSWTMLASLEEVMVSQDHWILVSDDVTKAFDNVNVDLLLEHHRLHLGNNELLIGLVEAVLRGDDPARKVGIDQGSPYMPTALNVFLHHVFDLHAHSLGANPGERTTWFRYADNLVVTCHDVEEGQQVILQMKQLLGAAGLALKGENDGKPVDLKRGGRVQLLGFSLSQQKSRLQLDLTPEAWDSLEKNLLKAHETSDPGMTAQAVLQGWIVSHGPTFHGKTDDAVDHLLHVASDYGFREVYDRKYYAGECRKAWNRWTALRRVRVRDRHGDGLHGDGDAERRLRQPPAAAQDPTLCEAGGQGVTPLPPAPLRPTTRGQDRADPDVFALRWDRPVGPRRLERPPACRPDGRRQLVRWVKDSERATVGAPSSSPQRRQERALQSRSPPTASEQPRLCTARAWWTHRACKRPRDPPRRRGNVPGWKLTLVVQDVNLSAALMPTVPSWRYRSRCRLSCGWPKQ